MTITDERRGRYDGSRLHRGGRLAGQSTSPTLPRHWFGRAGHCRPTSGSKPPTSMCLRLPAARGFTNDPAFLKDAEGRN